MLTSPRIWEALGLPLTTFEDSIDFFGDPGLVDEDSVRPFVAMKAQLHDYDPAGSGRCGYRSAERRRLSGDRFRYGADRYPELRALSL